MRYVDISESVEELFREEFIQTQWGDRIWFETNDRFYREDNWKKGLYRTEFRDQLAYCVGDHVSDDLVQNNPVWGILQRITEHGGSIISARQTSPEEVEKARLENRLYTDDKGFGFIYIPA